MVSSSGHMGGGIQFGDYGFENAGNEYTPWKAYGQSKTANIYMANEITRRYSSQGLFANSLMPGCIATGLQQYISAEIKEKWAKDPATTKIVKSTEQGAATTVLAAIDKEWEGIGGNYLEDCQEILSKEEKGGAAYFGYAKHAFDKDSEERLWNESLSMVKL